MKKYHLYNFILLSLLFFISPFIYAAKITQVDIHPVANKIEIDFRGVEQHPKIFALSHPDRLVLDFTKTHYGLSDKPHILHHTVVKVIRYGYPHPEVLRIVLEVNKPFHYVTTLKNHRLHLILSQEKIVTAAFTPTTPLVLPSPPKTRPFTVVIDPGHGGKDPGAIGKSHIQEKKIVLDIAKKLAREINQHPDMRAVLTRQGDYFVSLQNRLKLARKGKADLFIAIHADAHHNKKAEGASVYALSEYGATRLAARWLTDRDNHAQLGDVQFDQLPDQSKMLRSVLIDLAQTVTEKETMRIGNSLLNQLNAVTKLHYTRVEEAPFMVLKSPDIPSVLVELGFISNPKEEAKLNHSFYQSQLALALWEGIENYYQQHYLHK